MPQKEFIHYLSNEDKLKIKFITERGKLLFFIVQYYSLINGRWRTVMRVDSCHGFPHKHMYHLHSPEFKVSLEQDIDRAFNEAVEYIKKDYSKLRESFLNT